MVRERADGAREGVMLRWGLIPSWADSPAVGGRHFNARSETVAAKPTFREAFIRRRCLVPVSGFYEWRTQGVGKQPYYITRADGELFVLAGLWARWDGGDGGGIRGSVETFTILTTTPNALMRPLHDRMPVILGRDDYAAWVGCEPLSAGVAERLFEPRDDPGLEAFPVGKMVSNSRSDGEELTARVDPRDPREGMLF